MNDKASTQISADSDKAWTAWAWPPGRAGRATPGLLCPSGGDSTRTLFVGRLPWQAEAGGRTQDRKVS